MIVFWIVILMLVSVIWALIALKKEKNKKDLNEAKKDIEKGRVIFHSSDSSDSSSS